MVENHPDGEAELVSELAEAEATVVQVPIDTRAPTAESESSALSWRPIIRRAE
jgi:hypothetical protein